MIRSGQGYELVRRGEPAGDPKIVRVLTDIVWTTLYPAPSGKDTRGD